MEVIKKEIKSSDVNIYVISDVHWGSANCRERAFKEFVRTIKDDPKGYWIGLGDYIDAITIFDKRFSPGELMQKYSIKDLKDLPRIQMREFAEIIYPIKDKCLSLGIGNHEEAYIKYNHFDIYDYLVRDLLKIDNVKAGYNSFLELTLKRNAKSTCVCTFYLTHGAKGGGMREGFGLNYIHDIAKDKIADIYLTGHIHQLLVDKRQKLGINRVGDLTKKDSYYAVCGSWLDKYHIGTSGYFESARGWETQSGYIKININTTNHDHSLKIKVTQHD